MIRVAIVLLVLGVRLAAQQPATPESFCTFPPAPFQEKVRKEHGEGFALVETKHFRLISDSCPRYRKLIAGGLEQFYGLVHDRFFKKEMKPVAVFLIDGGSRPSSSASAGSPPLRSRHVKRRRPGRGIAARGVRFEVFRAIRS